MKYVGYDFEVKDGDLIFDEELDAAVFLKRHGFKDEGWVYFENRNGVLVLVCTDQIEENPYQTTLNFLQP